MATCEALIDAVDLTLCSICLEKLKSPRLLPCSHSFCQHCLCAHIVSTCEQKDVPLGFPCPLCREFIPSPGNPEETIKWAEKFPINDAMVLLMNESQDHKSCFNILAVEKVVKNMQRLGQMKSLEKEIEKMKVDLEIAKQSQKDNLGALEDDSDVFTKEAEELHQKVSSHVNKLFEEHFTEIAKNTKEAKRKLEKNTIAKSDRLDFLQYLLRLLKSANGTSDSEETRLNYISTLHKVKENLGKLSEYPLKPGYWSAYFSISSGPESLGYPVG
ncbi:tripartite motif-containing protein 5-like [Crassostrea angulata]|uniref:tripartite motif-containing protein 5-like n=1 Tax=Magallana angulata TaxID=2784310 RepID=UPI0022B124C9|nr:tripartite motif-containing protein 5-like [Crassostrea angulata]